jgi:lipoate-protein ligase A
MTSLSEILGHVPPIPKVKASIVKGMAQALGVVFAEGQLTSSEWALAHEMVNQLERTSGGFP